MQTIVLVSPATAFNSHFYNSLLRVKIRKGAHSHRDHHTRWLIKNAIIFGVTGVAIVVWLSVKNKTVRGH